MIAFKRVKDAYGWMSNMSPHPVHGFRTAEAAFQAFRFADESIRQLIKAEKSPMGAKMLAKKHVDKMIIQPRSHLDLMLMEAIVLAKLLQNPELKDQLAATDNQLIVEDVTARQNESGLFWGAAGQTQVGGEVTWTGENHLGKIWMKWRDQLRASKSWFAAR